MTPQQRRRAQWEREFETAKPAVRERSGGICERCQQARGEHVHHKLRRLHKRANELVFLAHLCGQCHREVHDRPAESYVDGWLIRFESVPEVAVALDGTDPFVSYCDERGYDPHAKAAEFNIALDAT